MTRMGKQSDLARELGISRSAVSQAFRKHDIQIAIGGQFDLDHALYLLQTKQNQAISLAQRKADKKQPIGLKNPKVRREIIRLLWSVWQEAITETIRSRVETSFVDKNDRRDVENYMLALMSVWDKFHRIIDRQNPPDIGDFQFRKPDCIDFDWMNTSMLDQINRIVSGEYLAEISPPPPDNTAALDGSDNLSGANSPLPAPVNPDQLANGEKND